MARGSLISARIADQGDFDVATPPPAHLAAESRGGRLRTIGWIVIGAITVSAAALDLLRLTAQPIWLDESLSIAIAQLSTRDFFIFVAKHEPFMSLYYVLLRIWLGFGQSAFVVRSLSVIFAVAAVPSLYLLGRRLFGARTAMLAAGLLAINSLFIQYAQEARSYTLTTFVVIWSWYALLRLFAEPGWRRIFYYALPTAALAYCQILSLLMLPAQWVAISILPNRKSAGLRFFAASTVIVGVLILPMVLASLPILRDEVDWIKPPDVFVALHQLLVRFINLPSMLGPPPQPLIVLFIVMLIPVALPIFGLASVVRAALQGMAGDRLFGYASAALGATIPLACLLAASLLIHPIYVMRYVLWSLPFGLLLLAAGLCELRPTVMRMGVVVLLAANMLGTLEYYRLPTKPDWPQAVEYLASRVRAEDKVAIVPWYEWYPVKYYLAALGRSDLASRVVFPARDSISYIPGEGAISTALAPGYSRLWIIRETSSRGDDYGEREPDKRYGCSSRKDFRGVSVALYALKDCERTASARRSAKATAPKE